MMPSQLECYRHIKKPIKKVEFLARIKNALRTGDAEKSLNKALHELEEKNIRLEELAITDGLTNLYNHRYLIKRLFQNMNIAERYKTPLSIIMLDIDHF